MAAVRRPASHPTRQEQECVAPGFARSVSRVQGKATTVVPALVSDNTKALAAIGKLRAPVTVLRTCLSRHGSTGTDRGFAESAPLALHPLPPLLHYLRELSLRCAAAARNALLACAVLGMVHLQPRLN